MCDDDDDNGMTFYDVDDVGITILLTKTMTIHTHDECRYQYDNDIRDDDNDGTESLSFLPKQDVCIMMILFSKLAKTMTLNMAHMYL